MGSRRTHEEAAVAAARAAYLAGFAATSNLEAGRRYGIPTAGTSAHAFTLLHDDEQAAFRAQVDTLGPETTLLVDTYDVEQGIRTAVEVAGPGLGAVRSTPATCRARHARPASCSTRSARPGPGSCVTSDLDEYAIAGLAAAPVDALRRRHVAGHRLGRADGGHGLQAGRARRRAGGEDAEGKGSARWPQDAVRRHDADGTAIAEVVQQRHADPPPATHDRELVVPLVRGGEGRDRDPAEALEQPGSCTSGRAATCRRRRWALSRGEARCRDRDGA